MIDYKRLLDFEIFVMDIIEESDPKDAEDYENLSDTLHQSLENAIYEMILDTKNTKIEEEYDPRY